jgi:hypothetical protein
MATVQLSSSKAGISRLRIKGGAEQDTLYDLLNGYVDQSGAVVSRPGSVEAYTIPAGTIGMVSVNGGLTVFSDHVVSGIPAGVTLEVLPHPTDSTQTLVKIHFAGPFLGDGDGAFLYVAAEYSNGDVFHFWLQRATTWGDETAYRPGDLVQPTVPNGYVYRAHRLGEPGEIWEAGAERALGDVVEPTESNGYEYEVIEAIGAPPRSGATEPIWPTEEGQTVTEEADVDLPAPPTQTNPPPSVPPRYGNPGGSSPNSGLTNTDIL